ncbi:dUTP diphosphatase [Aneurinibacillus migulanus]|uniref:Dimeric dUTPase, all-alpha-NTP-PPase (MazG) superfamily n=1 Tax=Aneurinibacillus migulanus TaxID=47500 RepID=A0A0D1XTG5_ANEMI|nr:dUTP diphosphatase [Aneurinibacillus migulanus]KIV57516.1 hypothetical protein TS65_09855 [Aneurinibacillus migulanus]KON94868.1 hypothetical protein AF333_04570 [Aneurinibacillus migulanus]MED0892869.1 dUTP diphosphatase [Aneurinibacillus migulanus]MED1619115.1 dUTP diphosphatase [Aneurinibacillus migulanus]SDI92034.1 Dimeric dUTPase, all-alpha-NTP-PPase (MazG) superfamily [Aneurinibacillus migulanus]
MNLSKLFDMQRVLDERIIKDKGLEGKDLLPGKILALQVELGELANEWRGFKFWSNNQKPCITGHKGRCERCEGTGYISTQYDLCDAGCFKGLALFNPLLEEYVDCLHFLLSIGLELEVNQHLNINPYDEKDIITQFNKVFKLVTELQSDDFYKAAQWQLLKRYFFGLGEMLGFTFEQIEQAYLDKNAVNHQRQEAGY